MTALILYLAAIAGLIVGVGIVIGIVGWRQHWREVQKAYEEAE